MLFHLTTLNLEKFLYEDTSALKENETNKKIVVVVDAWKHVNFLCKNYKRVMGLFGQEVQSRRCQNEEVKFILGRFLVTPLNLDSDMDLCCPEFGFVAIHQSDNHIALAQIMGSQVRSNSPQVHI